MAGQAVGSEHCNGRLDEAGRKILRRIEEKVRGELVFGDDRTALRLALLQFVDLLLEHRRFALGWWRGRRAKRNDSDGESQRERAASCDEHAAKIVLPLQRWRRLSIWIVRPVRLPCGGHELELATFHLLF